MVKHKNHGFWHQLRFREEFLIVVVLLFFSTGGLIDFWQASMEHNYYLPQFLKDYFGIFWLILYTGIFPFLMVFDLSNFNLKMAKVYFGALLLGSLVWDLIYSSLDTGRLISAQPGYFYLQGKNYGLTELQMYVWNIARLFFGLILVKDNLAKNKLWMRR